jgi:hypothetical protein
VGHRAQPRGRARITDHEDEIPLFDPGLAPGEVVDGPYGPAILIGSEEGNVEIVPGELEVVGIAAEVALITVAQAPLVGVDLWEPRVSNHLGRPGLPTRYRPDPTDPKMS